MADLPFGRVCEAYLCPANATFPQFELIQTLSRDFEGGPVSVSFTVRLTWVAQETGHTHKIREADLSMSPSENGSKSFCAPQHNEGSRQEDITAVGLVLQHLEREVHTFLQQRNTRCICTGEDASVVQGK